MKKNMNKSDGIIRALMAAIIAVLFFTNFINGIFGLVLLIAAVIFLITSMIHICPIYRIFGVSTC